MQEGGYQEPAPEPVPEPPTVVAPPAASTGFDTPAANGTSAMSRQPSQAGSTASGIMIGDSDIDMGGTAAGLLDQMHTGLSSHSTPNNNFPTPQPQLSAMPSNVGTPSNMNAPSPQPAPKLGEANDVKMDGTGATEPASVTTPDQGTGSGDWVVVPKGDPESDAKTSEPPKGTTNSTPKPISATGTPGAGSTGYDGNDFSSLGDLGSFGDTPGGMDLNMDLEDSAFGNAFHGVDSQGGDTPGNM
jgi:hypothetical protein